VQHHLYAAPDTTLQHKMPKRCNRSRVKTSVAIPEKQVGASFILLEPVPEPHENEYIKKFKFVQ
jgi:hypothetical protein